MTDIEQLKLVEALRKAVGEMQKLNIVEKGCLSTVSSSEFEYTHDSDPRRCNLTIYHVNGEWYELELTYSCWPMTNLKNILIKKDSDISVINQCLYDCELVQKLVQGIIDNEEGPYVNVVSIPEGVKQMGPLQNDVRKGSSDSENPLRGYGRIGLLNIPSSVDIPHSDDFSPFAYANGRPHVYNGDTEFHVVRIEAMNNDSPHLYIEDGVIYSADKTRLIYCFRMKQSFSVPLSVKIIEPFAFCGQKSMASIELHNGIIYIGRAAFMGCKALRTVSLPDKLTVIYPSTFDGCTNLSQVVLPSELVSILYEAFCKCVSLKEINFPNTLKHLDGFDGCESLSCIEVPAGVEDIKGFMFCSSLKRVHLHEGVKKICGYAFRYCDNLESINIPEGVEEIGNRAFMPSYNATNKLRRIVLPTTLKRIGIQAFYFNRKLRNVIFQCDSCTVEQGAFACTSFFRRIKKPDKLKLNRDVFLQDAAFDKWAFWD